MESTVGQRVKGIAAKRRQAVEAARRGARRASNTGTNNNSTSGDAASNTDFEDDENTPSTPSAGDQQGKKPANYAWEDSDDGVESEANLDLATTPLNLGRKRKYSESTFSASPRPSPSPSPSKKQRTASASEPAIELERIQQQGEEMEGEEHQAVNKTANVIQKTPEQEPQSSDADDDDDQSVIEVEEGEIIKKEKPQKSTESAVAKKRKFADDEVDSSDEDTPRSNKKQEVATPVDTEGSDLEYTPDEVEVVKETGTLKINQRKSTKESRSATANKSADSDSEYELEANKPTRKTGTKAQKKTAALKKGNMRTKKAVTPKKGNRRTKKTTALNKAARPQRVMKIFKKPETPPPTERQLRNMREAANEQDAYNRLPQEYKNTKWLRDQVDDFCMRMGIGRFPDLEREQQLRLLKELRKRAEYTSLLDVQKSAINAKNRQVRSWEAKSPSLQSNVTVKTIHSNRMAIFQRELTDATGAVDAWEARDGHITYKVAYDAAVKVRGQKYGIDDSQGPKMLARRAKFFAGPLPVEIWEKHVADDAAAADNSAASSSSSSVVAREDRLRAAMSSKKKLASTAAGNPVSDADDASSTSDADPEESNPFAQVSAKTALKLCSFITYGIVRVKIGKAQSHSPEVQSTSDQLRAQAYDIQNKVVMADTVDGKFDEAVNAYILRKLEHLARLPMGSLHGTEGVLFQSGQTFVALEDAKRKIGELHGVQEKMSSSTWLAFAINKSGILELPTGLLREMMSFSDSRKGSAA